MYAANDQVALWPKKCECTEAPRYNAGKVDGSEVGEEATFEGDTYPTRVGSSIGVGPIDTIFPAKLPRQSPASRLGRVRFEEEREVVAVAELDSILKFPLAAGMVDAA